jgi:hypothetical protein
MICANGHEFTDPLRPCPVCGTWAEQESGVRSLAATARGAEAPQPTAGQATFGCLILVGLLLLLGACFNAVVLDGDGSGDNYCRDLRSDMNDAWSDGRDSDWSELNAEFVDNCTDLLDD